MSRNKWIFAAMVLAVLAASQARADFDKTKWEFCRTISGQTNAKLSRLPLDRDVLLNASPYYSDLRIIDNQGKETPFKLLELTGAAEIKSVKPTATNISVVPGKYSSMTLNIESRMNSNRLLIDTPEKNFTCRVEVAGQNGDGPWEVLRSDAYIFDFSRGNHARSAEVTYPESDYSTLRVRIFADNGRIIKATEATVVWKQPIAQRNTVFFNGKGTLIENSKDKTTEISLRLKGDNLPAGTMRMVSPTINYQRRIDMLGSRDGKTWESIGSGYILKYRTEKFKADVSNVGFDGGVYSRVKVVIHNGDDEPIFVDRIMLETPERQLAFAPKAGVSYRLFYGNKSATAPSYDIQSLYAYLSGSASKQTPFTLGPQERNPDYVVVIAKKPWLEAYPWAIWAAMGAAMAVLIAFVLNLARQIKAGPPSA
ncbi:MAG TPA: hypothetical protein VGK34_03370 [Armatimonadota bacterium]